MKNVSYLTIKALLFSRYLNVCLDFLVTCKNGLTIKITLISKSMTPEPGKQTIAIHIKPNTSRSKGNQTMKFGLLMEHIIRNIFLEKSYRKCGGKNIPRSLSKQPKLSISLDQ